LEQPCHVAPSFIWIFKGKCRSVAFMYIMHYLRTVSSVFYGKMQKQYGKGMVLWFIKKCGMICWRWG
jgi:hypothetical protein